MNRTKRILVSMLLVIAVGGVVALGTRAFFSDTESSLGNVLEAGSIDLKVDNQSYYNGEPSTNTSWTLNDLTIEKFFNFLDLKPGDWGEDTISLHVTSNPAWLCSNITLTSDDDFSSTEPELDEVGEVEENAQDLFDGELGSELNLVAWIDDGDNVYECLTGDVNSTELALIDEQTRCERIILNGTPSGIDGSQTYAIADASGNAAFDEPIQPDTTYYIGKYWCFGDISENPVAWGEGQNPTVATGFTCDGAGTSNISQTDRVTADIHFYVEQHRNNLNFACSEVKWPTQGEEGPAVGAALSAYVVPTGCDVTVTGSQSIQTAVTGASVDTKVCVDSTYDGTGDNTRILIDVAGLTLAAMTRGVDLDVPVTLSASSVTVTGFDGVVGQAATPAEQAAFYAEGDANNFEISFNTVTGGAGAAVLTESGGSLGGGLIANNVLNGATQGIYTNPHTGTITIQYNDIDNNVAGIGGLMGALVQYNEFEHSVPNSEAIGVDSTHDSNPATVSLNNFLNGTMLNTYGAIAGDVSALNNFWGLNGGAAQTGGTDEVVFTPEAVAQYPHN